MPGVLPVTRNLIAHEWGHPFFGRQEAQDKLASNELSSQERPLLRFLGYAPLLALFVLLPPTQTAHAQSSVYGTVAATDFCLNSSSGTSCKRATLGFLAGGFYNFPIQSRLTAGIDGRMSYGIGTRGGVSATAALRIGFVPHSQSIAPLLPNSEAVW